MKKICLLFFVLCFLTENISAQQQRKENGFAPSNPKTARHLKQLSGLCASVMATSKTTGPKQRLVAETEVKSSSLDSTTYSYTGIHGSEFDFINMRYERNYYYSSFVPNNMRYDTLNNYSQSLSQPDDTIYRVYSATDKIISMNGSVNREVFTYNAQDQVILFDQLYFDMINQQWDTTLRNAYIHNAQGQLSVDSVLFNNSGTLVNDYKDEFSYNTAGLPVQVMSYLWNGAGWDIDTRTSIAYNSSNQAETFLEEQFDGINWENTFKDSIAYSGNQIKTRLSFDWDTSSSSWVPVREEFRNLNGNNLPDSIFQRSYLSSLGDWDTTIIKTTYNSFDNPVTLDYTYFLSGLFSYHYFYQYYYELYLDVQDVRPAKTINIYPNPVKDVLYLSTEEIKNSGDIQLSVINALGQTVIKSSIALPGDKISIPVHKLPKGFFQIIVRGAKASTYRASFIKE